MKEDIKPEDVMSTIQSKMPIVGKENQGHGYQYRSIVDAMNALGPITKELGVTISKRILSKESSINRVIKYENVAVDKTRVEKVAREIDIRFVDVTIEYNFMYKNQTVFTTEASAHGVDLSCYDKAMSVANSTAYRQMVFDTFVIAYGEDSDMALTATEGSAPSNAQAKEQSKPEMTSDQLQNFIRSASSNSRSAALVKKNVLKFRMTPDQAKAINQAIATGATKTLGQ